MSTQGCGVKHPLRRDGLSQAQRFLRELTPDYVAVDERKPEDLLVFASEMAEKVRYYDLNNEEDGHWQEFFTRDISVQIALITIVDTDKRRADFRQLYDDTLAAPTRANLVLLFEAVMEVIRETEHWNRQVRANERFFTSIQNQIRSRLQRPVQRLIALGKGAVVIDPPKDAIELDWTGLMPLWVEDPNTIAANEAPYGTGTTEAELVSQAMQRVRSIFNTIVETQVRIVAEADRYLLETLENYPGHHPHMALFIAFIYLFRHAQDHLNTLTSRHLDFYFREVLLLEPKAAVPDQVHLIFELAKNQKVHLVEAGTRFKAGKDADGQELIYRLDADTILNRGTVAELKTVFLDANDQYRIHAAPVANSGDGLGGEFDDPDMPVWKPLGSTESPKAEVGFAVSSPILRLAEGERLVTFELMLEPRTWQRAKTIFDEKVKTCDTEAKRILELTDVYTVELTGEKGYVQVPEGDVRVTEWSSTNTIKIELLLMEDFEAVVDYNPKFHTDGIDAIYPVAKLKLNPEHPLFPYLYQQDLLVEKIKFTVDVKNVRNLVVQNQVTILNSKSAFQPFGATPAVGFDFYIGSHEIFSKQPESLKFHVLWDELPVNFNTHYNHYTPQPSVGTVRAEWSLLDERQWKTMQDGPMTGAAVDLKTSLFLGERHPANGAITQQAYDPDSPLTWELETILMEENGQKVNVGRQPDLEVFEDYSYNRQRGFVRLRLSGSDLGHAQYPNLLTRMIVNQQFDGNNQLKLPKPPYTPVIKEISVDYVASQTLDLRFEIGLVKPVRPKFEERIERFYHLHPFGHEEVHPDIYAGLPNGVTRADRFLPLQPQWTGEGNLYIGISGMDLKASSTVNLFFQMVEGTANPDVKKPEITWSWLGENSWTDFKSFEITNDTTNGLVTSGLMTFAFPPEALAEHTVLPGGQHWIRATVATDVSGLADVISIVAQAGRATFSDQDNSPLHLSAPLPAETIAKMKVKEAEIKSVTQPFASFNGRMAEDPQVFYTRASERLRHKDRAITIWDYESLVLEAFPDLYRVKCISHTNAYTQLAPGHVYLVLVTRQINKNAVNKLEPRASVNTLEEVDTFIRARSTPFLKLIVQNPDYEGIQLDFKVAFRRGFDAGYYELQLNEDLKKYLTPWAYSDGEEISFEGRIHSSVILDFVEELPYVDYLTDFRLKQFSKQYPAGQEVAEAIATSPMSILVSYPQHVIDVIPTPANNG